MQVFFPDVIRLRDSDKEPCSYEDTCDTRTMRGNLDRFNTFISEHWIDLCVSDDEFKTALKRKAPEERRSDQNEGVIDLTRVRLHRVFNRSFDEGGRFYGPWWQGVPRAMRMYITINGEPTQELDYAGLHLAMLYAKVGEPLVGDPYVLEGIGPEYRKLVKVTLMKMINAETGRMRRPEGMPLPPGMTWTTLRDAIAQSHPAIAGYLRSGEGVRLQRIDADVAEDVMLSMMSRGILVLPIHDSFVVDYRYADILRSEMLRAYRERLGAEIGIEADPSMIDELVTPSEYEVRDFMARRQAGSDFRGYRERNRASQDGKSTRDVVEPSTPIQPRMSPHEITPTFLRPKSLDSESWTYSEYVAFWPLAIPSPALVP